MAAGNLLYPGAAANGYQAAADYKETIWVGSIKSGKEKRFSSGGTGYAGSVASRILAGSITPLAW